MLANSKLLDHSDVSIAFENEAIFDICRNSLKVESPGYSNLNRIIAQFLGSTTFTLRFDGCILIDLAEYQSSLVPYPRAHFIIPSYSPLVPIGTI